MLLIVCLCVCVCVFVCVRPHMDHNSYSVSMDTFVASAASSALMHVPQDYLFTSPKRQAFPTISIPFMPLSPIMVLEDYFQVQQLFVLAGMPVIYVSLLLAICLLFSIKHTRHFAALVIVLRFDSTQLDSTRYRHMYSKLFNMLFRRQTAISTISRHPLIHIRQPSICLC